MSLINDALKRASNKKNPPGDGGPVLQPVTESDGKGKKAILLVLLLLLVGGAGYAGWTWWSGRSATANNAPAATNNSAAKTPALPATNNPVARAAATLEAATNRGESKTSEVSPADTKTTAATSTPATAENAATNIAPAVAPPKDLRLQGIFFRMKDPTAIINGKTVRNGDEIDGAKVVRIDRASVRVEVNGQQKDLTLK